LADLQQTVYPHSGHPSADPNLNPRYLTLRPTLLRNARYETPGYEKVTVRNVWHPYHLPCFALNHPLKFKVWLHFGRSSFTVNAPSLPTLLSQTTAALSTSSCCHCRKKYYWFYWNPTDPSFFNPHSNIFGDLGPKMFQGRRLFLCFLLLR